MRKKKTPEELAAEAEQEDLDDFTSKYSKVFQIDALVVLISGLITLRYPLHFPLKSSPYPTHVAKNLSWK